MKYIGSPLCRFNTKTTNHYNPRTSVSPYRRPASFFELLWKDFPSSLFCSPNLHRVRTQSAAKNGDLAWVPKASTFLFKREVTAP
eukprot:796155-Rhodomonas_salina.1